MGRAGPKGKTRRVWPARGHMAMSARGHMAMSARGHMAMSARGHMAMSARGHMAMSARGHMAMSARGHMAIAERTDPRITRTNRAFERAIVELASQRPVSEITVAELAAHAG